MFPGLTTRASESTVASATTIRPKSDIVLLTGSTAIATIDPPFGGSPGVIILIPTDGTLATTTAGNIALVVTMAQSQSCFFSYSYKNNKWYPGAIS